MLSRLALPIALGPALSLALGCAGPRPRVDDVLASRQLGTRETASEASRGSVLQEAQVLAAVDALASERRARAHADPGDAEAQIAAASGLFVAAELRSELSLARALDAAPPRDFEALVELEEELSEPWSAEIRSLSEEGELLARRALELTPGSAAAHHYRALHLAASARAGGFLQSLLAGLGPALESAAEAAVAADPTFEGGSPLVLLGRFLDVAPWPLGDEEAALAHLERAATLGPTIPGALFLGDALERAGRTEEARAAWRLAFAVVPGGDAAALAPFQLSRVRLRLALTDAGEL